MRAPDLLHSIRLPKPRKRATGAEPKPSLLKRLGGERSGQTADALVERIALGATAMIVAFFWLPSLFRSLWTDETVAYWIVDASLADTIDRANSLQESSSAYYVLMNLWSRIAGLSEFLLRLPSFLAAIAAAYLVYQLGRGLHRRVTGLVAALVFVGFHTVFVGATSMTPFAFEVLLLLVSTRALMWWVAEERLSYGLVWIIAAVGAVYMHPFALLALVGQVFFLIAARRRGQVEDLAQLAGLSALGGVALAPLIPQWIDLFENRDLHLLEASLSINDLLVVLIPPVVIASWLVGLAFVRRISDEPAVSGEPATLMVLWAVVPPVAVFVASILSAYSIWSGEYYIAALPALAILLGGMFSRLTSTDGRRIAVVLLVALTFLAIAPSSGSTIEEDWAGAVAWSNAQTNGNDSLVLVASGLPQSRDVGVLLNPALSEFLVAPVTVYGVHSEAIALPFTPDNGGTAYVELVASDDIEGMEQVVVMERTAQGFSDYGAVLAAGLADEGFSVVSRPEFDGLNVTLLQRG